ncbi:Uncharacterised protein [Chlamydia trachomatis]|nr:Uncharacterised protein [Chlamydia trachomatis]
MVDLEQLLVHPDCHSIHLLDLDRLLHQETCQYPQDFVIDQYIHPLQGLVQTLHRLNHSLAGLHPYIVHHLEDLVPHVFS